MQLRVESGPVKISRDFACLVCMGHVESTLPRQTCVFSVLQCQFYLSTLDGAVSLDFRFAWVLLQPAFLLPPSIRSISYQFDAVEKKPAQTERLVEKHPTECSLKQKQKVRSLIFNSLCSYC